MAALKDRVAKLEAQSHPIAVDAWFEMACATEPNVNFPACLRVLCEWDVLLKPSPGVWEKVDKAWADEFGALAHLSDDELLRLAREPPSPEDGAAELVLLFETFQAVPRDFHAPGASKKLAECLRFRLKTVRPDVAEWNLLEIERLLRHTSAKLSALYDATGNARESDALDFILNYPTGVTTP